MISGGDVTACGDRGLRSEGTVTISGGRVLATATDDQCRILTTSDQASIALDLTKEWSKNNPITLTDESGKTVFDKNTLKKYRYVVVSSPDLKAGTAYNVYAGGIEVKSSSDIKAGETAAYSDVNNTFKSSLSQSCSLSGEYRFQFIWSSALDAIVSVNASVKFKNIFAPGHLMKSVYILCYNSLAFAFFLKTRECHMCY